MPVIAEETATGAELEAVTLILTVAWFDVSCPSLTVYRKLSAPTKPAVGV